MLSHIEPIARRLASGGELSEDDRATLKKQYLLDIGAPPDCQPCSSVWSDIRHHFLYQLKQLTPVSTLKKFIIIGAGLLMLPGASYSIANDGEETENRKILTDELAEEILEANPSYSELIKVNPAWLEANPDEAGDEEEGDESADAAEIEAKYKKQISTLKGQLTRMTKERDELKAALSTKAVDSTPPSDPANSDSDPSESDAEQSND
ncbi:hypothetical protein [Spirosoma fluminis]